MDSFYLRLENHIDKRMTGPYHAICSLYDVLPKHEEFQAAVLKNKQEFLKLVGKYITLPASHQPILCTYANCEITSHDPRAVLYKPRSSLSGSVVCHLGEVHLGRDARGSILEKLEVKDSYSK